MLAPLHKNNYYHHHVSNTLHTILQHNCSCPNIDPAVCHQLRMEEDLETLEATHNKIEKSAVKFTGSVLKSSALPP